MSFGSSVRKRERRESSKERLEIELDIHRMLDKLTWQQLRYLYDHGDSELKRIVTAEMSARQISATLSTKKEEK